MCLYGVLYIKSDLRTINDKEIRKFHTIIIIFLSLCLLKIIRKYP